MADILNILQALSISRSSSATAISAFAASSCKVGVSQSVGQQGECPPNSLDDPISLTATNCNNSHSSANTRFKQTAAHESEPKRSGVLTETAQVPRDLTIYTYGAVPSSQRAEIMPIVDEHNGTNQQAASRPAPDTSVQVNNQVPLSKTQGNGNTTGTNFSRSSRGNLGRSSSQGSNVAPVCDCNCKEIKELSLDESTQAADFMAITARKSFVISTECKDRTDISSYLSNGDKYHNCQAPSALSTETDKCVILNGNKKIQDYSKAEQSSISKGAYTCL